jgi:hypothetical protein
MGLDMYLHREVSIPAYDIDDGEDGYFAKGRERAAKVAAALDEPLVLLGGSYEVKVPAAYWRKANAIHDYIVRMHGDDTDGSREIELSSADLKELARLCKEVLADHSKAEELLPTASGFFFGSSEYDDYYYEDLRETVRMLEAGLVGHEGEFFTYRASW